ncbi:hypothetical protein VNO77_20573 [Canavalia gladiata]|uniref:Uncharacterized protein n=1 Tax=Canavalia gladiata TaxID=3824 RepID=A0AAN9QLJ3_CANGL
MVPWSQWCDMYDSTHFNHSCLLFWFDNVESKLFSAVRICLSKCEYLVVCIPDSFGHSILSTTAPDIGRKMVIFSMVLMATDSGMLTFCLSRNTSLYFDPRKRSNWTLDSIGLD